MTNLLILTTFSHDYVLILLSYCQEKIDVGRLQAFVIAIVLKINYNFKGELNISFKKFSFQTSIYSYQSPQMVLRWSSKTMNNFK